MIVSAPGFDGAFIDGGRAYLYLGSATGLAETPAWIDGGTQRAMDFGHVRPAGDVDGDGYDDVLVGSGGFDHGQRNEGLVALYMGSASGLTARSTWTMESNQRDSIFGTTLAGAGDVNGDGYDDLMVAAMLYDNGEHDEGRVWVLLGQTRMRSR